MLYAEKTKSGIQAMEVEAYLVTNRIISITGTIDSKMSNNIVQMLIALNSKSDEEITMLISSPGGEITSGLAIYDAMKITTAPIRTVAVGTVASMAAVLFSSGTKGRRQMFPSSRIMIHNPRIAGSDSVLTSTEIIELGKNLQKMSAITNSILADNTGKSLKQLNKDTLADNWMDAGEALAYGLADEILERI